jgi:hypothetical protein
MELASLEFFAESELVGGLNDEDFFCLAKNKII